MAHRMQGLIFVLLGFVGLFDAWRIRESVRPTADLDGIGPDGYLAILSVIMLVLGLALAIRSKIEGETGDWSDLARWPPVDYVVVAVIMALFVLAIPLIGFSISSLLFFLALFGLLGDWSWPRTVGYAVVTTVVIYVVFVYFADMSLPKSFLGV